MTRDSVTDVRFDSYIKINDSKGGRMMLYWREEIDPFEKCDGKVDIPCCCCSSVLPGR